MSSVTTTNGAFTLTAYRGDRKTLLAFDLEEASSNALAGFTLQCEPNGQAPYYIQNALQFETPANHAQDAAEPANSSINAPIHKFRWFHIPGSVHQGLDPFLGDYTYTVTPRFFDTNGSMLPLDPTKSASVKIDVNDFVKGNLKVGFTRGFTQSQAFVNHFGKNAKIRPTGHELQYDTSVVAGTNAAGQQFTYDQEYLWLGYTAREIVFELLTEVLEKNLIVDVFAYDLNEPGIVAQLVKLATAGKLRLILDNAALHHDATGNKPEDQVEALIRGVSDGADMIKRGHFGRYAHDKVFVVRDKDSKDPIKVLTGSTNFSVTGLYVNSNHVLLYTDAVVAKAYGGVFDTVWSGGVTEQSFVASAWSSKVFQTNDEATPSSSITFSPHTTEFATTLLGELVDRIETEGQQTKSEGSVLFAVMQINDDKNPVYKALNDLHADQSIFSYGISDSPDGIYLYPIAEKEGVLVTGKPSKVQLPPPFNQVPSVGIGHQIHHKFVVCGFNRDDAVVYCGSSNLALGGEEQNGDNLIAIKDSDVATVFAIEALSLVDHFDFLDRYSAKSPGGRGPGMPAAAPVQAAAQAKWFLATTDAWKAKYYDPNDLHCADRQLFA